MTRFLRGIVARTRFAVALSVFAAIYLVAICIRLAWRGRTLTRIGSTLDVPEVAKVDDDLSATRAEIRKLTARMRLVGSSQNDPQICCRPIA